MRVLDLPGHFSMKSYSHTALTGDLYNVPLSAFVEMRITLKDPLLYIDKYDLK